MMELNSHYRGNNRPTTRLLTGAQNMRKRMKAEIHARRKIAKQQRDRIASHSSKRTKFFFQ